MVRITKHSYFSLPGINALAFSHEPYTNNFKLIKTVYMVSVLDKML